MASEVVTYWRTAWSERAQVRTLTFVETSGTEQLLFRVTDEAGGSWDCANGAACPGLTFTAGVPVTLTLKNAAGNIGRHTLTAPPFYRTVAWWKAESADAEYRAPAFDSVHLQVGAEDRAITLSFVPMVPGSYLSYCTLGVMNGTRFAEIAAGTVEPNLATGHAGRGMHAMITVTDPNGALNGITFAQDKLADRDPLLDLDERRSPSWWTSPGTNQGRCCFPRELELVDVSDSAFEYVHGGARVSEVNPLMLYEGFGHPLVVQNRSMTRRHTVTVPQLFVHSVLLRAEDSQGEVRLPYLTGVAVKAQRQTTLYVSPGAPAFHEAYCDVGTRHGAHGAPDLGTGHAGSGMHGPIIVLPETATTTGR